MRLRFFDDDELKAGRSSVRAEFAEEPNDLEKNVEEVPIAESVVGLRKLHAVMTRILNLGEIGQELANFELRRGIERAIIESRIAEIFDGRHELSQLAFEVFIDSRLDFLDSLLKPFGDILLRAVGCRNRSTLEETLKHLRQNVAALDIKLTAEDMAEIDKAFPAPKTKRRLEMT